MLVTNIEDFLVPDAVSQLMQIMDSAKDECAALFKEGGGSTPAGSGGGQKNRKKKKRVADVFAKTPKQKQAELSQKLVMDLVDFIEEKGLLKEGVFGEDLKFGGGHTGSDNIVSCLCTGDCVFLLVRIVQPQLSLTNPKSKTNCEEGTN